MSNPAYQLHHSQVAVVNQHFNRLPVATTPVSTIPTATADVATPGKMQTSNQTAVLNAGDPNVIAAQMAVAAAQRAALGGRIIS